MFACLVGCLIVGFALALHFNRHHAALFDLRFEKIGILRVGAVCIAVDEQLELKLVCGAVTCLGQKLFCFFKISLPHVRFLVSEDAGRNDAFS